MSVQIEPNGPHHHVYIILYSTLSELNKLQNGEGMLMLKMQSKTFGDKITGGEKKNVIFNIISNINFVRE